MGDSASAGMADGDREACPAIVAAILWRCLGVGGIQGHAILWRVCWGLLSLGRGMVWLSQAETDSRPYYGPINVSPHQRRRLWLEVVILGP
jgi:hypothetical protein